MRIEEVEVSSTAAGAIGSRIPKPVIGGEGGICRLSELQRNAVEVSLVILDMLALNGNELPSRSLFHCRRNAFMRIGTLVSLRIIENVIGSGSEQNQCFIRALNVDGLSRS